MDTGFKRLWTRRKSKGLDASSDANLKDLRAIQNTNQFASHSTTKKSLPSPPGHKTGILGNASAGQDGSVRPPSSNRKQPMLVGISRPSTTISRPGTAGSGSLMNAVTRAADSIAVPDQDYRKSADKYTKTQGRSKEPRSVDIFAVSHPASPKLYNEDIAERNLDPVRTAPSSAHYPYRASAKYQEDVASRNAYPPLAADIVADQSRSSYPIYYDDGLNIDYSRSNTSGDHLFSRSTNSSQLVRPHSQDNADDQNLYKSPEDVLQGHHSPNSRRPASGNNQGDQVSNTGLHSIPNKDRQPNGSHSSQRAKIQDGYRSDSLRNYVLSQSELVHGRPSDKPPAQRRPVTASHDMVDHSHLSDRSTRPASAMSNSSSFKRSITLANRTIMDLTADDSEILSEISPESAYSSSPILENAKTDTMQRIHALVVSPTPNPDSVRGSRPTRGSDRPRKDKDPSPVVASSVPCVQPFQNPVSQQVKPKQTTNSTSLPSSFSPINTVASFEPRRSVLIDSQPNREIAGKHNLEFENEPTGRKEQLLDDKKADEKINPRALNMTDSSTLVAHEDNVRNLALKSVQYHSSQEHADRTNDSVQAQESISESTPLRSHSLVDSRDTIATPQNEANIQTTPESLHSIDFVDPTRSFGVTARDFAITPSKPVLESVPEDLEPNLYTKPQVPVQLTVDRRTTSHDSSSSKVLPSRNPTLYKSTFDEVEFAQKQAEARAALIRLQQSLNENFLTQPPPQSHKLPSRIRHHSSLSDGKPVAPSSIFAQVRTISPALTDHRLSVATSTSSDDARPRTSYHSLTTTTNINSDHQVTNTTLPLGLENDKVKAQLEPNGPGPSIINDEAYTNPPPILPNPLYMNGQILPRHLNNGPVPPSPGEISLSSFPIPISSPRHSFRREHNTPDLSRQSTASQSQQNNMNSPGIPRPSRRPSSVRSQASSTSQFSIPYHMIPDRSSSARDRLLSE